MAMGQGLIRARGHGTTVTFESTIPWEQARPWIRQPHDRRRVGDPLAALSNLEAVPDRIDAVAQDINSGALAYAAIGAWELGELLGLDWEDAPTEWAYTTLRARMSLQDAGYDLPYAENIQLLDGLIPDARYAELQGLTDDPCQGADAEDLPLTDEEIELLEERYAEAMAADAWGVGLARTELVASDGTVLHFEVEIGDAGDLENPKGPYESGEFLDLADWIEID
jgi:hypothetical protein